MKFPSTQGLTGIAKELAEDLIDSRKRELELIADLTREQMLGPSMRIIEPPIWELGHVGWFQDRWILQNLDDEEPMSAAANKLYDSYNIPNEDRWDLAFPSTADTLKYITPILDRIVARLMDKDTEFDENEQYYYHLSLGHEDMHSETLHHIRQTLKYPAPKLTGVHASNEQPQIDQEYEGHDVEIPGGTYMLGATRDIPFVWDNEKWAHPVEVAPFKIATTPVTVAEYLAFVEADGYADRSIWSDEGWAWRTQANAIHPAKWEKDGDLWLMCRFDGFTPLQLMHPMIHVNWYEANAYAAWAGRRLPTEAEWELAASGEPTPDGRGFTQQKRWFPWGNEKARPEHGNLNSAWMGTTDVRAFAAGDSAFGARQMLGNVWEWTASTFDGFPGFEIQPYEEYSEPSFGQQKVLRGGCWATRSRLIRNTFRNFYTPDRNDIFAGFRTVV